LAWVAYKTVDAPDFEAAVISVQILDLTPSEQIASDLADSIQAAVGEDFDVYAIGGTVYCVPHPGAAVAQSGTKLLSAGGLTIASLTESADRHVDNLIRIFSPSSPPPGADEVGILTITPPPGSPDPPWQWVLQLPRGLTGAEAALMFCAEMSATWTPGLPWAPLEPPALPGCSDVDEIFGVRGEPGVEVRFGIFPSLAGAPVFHDFAVYDNCSIRKGDVNGDTEVTMDDAYLAAEIALGWQSAWCKQWEADCNGPACEGDGKIDVLDVVKIVNLSMGLDTCP